MPARTSFPFNPGDRVAVRDRPWRVDAAEPYGEGRALLRLLPSGVERVDETKQGLRELGLVGRREVGSCQNHDGAAEPD